MIGLKVGDGESLQSESFMFSGFGLPSVNPIVDLSLYPLQIFFFFWVCFIGFWVLFCKLDLDLKNGTTAFFF